MRRLGLLSLAVALAGITFAATSLQSAETRLAVSAAASLSEAFTALDSRQRYSFGGSNALEMQIRQGAPADLFASASPVNTQRLFRAGLVERPVPFAGNRLALIVPRSNPAGIRSVHDLRSKPVELVIAGPAVPAGGYTRTVLRRLGLSSVLGKVVSQEPDVKSVAGKVALGQADAGFVYATDARPVRDRVTVIPIPARVQPPIRYEIAVVSRSANKAAARRWIAELLSAQGRRALESAGFHPLPKPAP